MAEVEVDDSANNFIMPSIQILDNNGSATVQANWAYFAGNTVNTWTGTSYYVIRTPALQLRADAGTESLIARLNGIGEGGGAGGIDAVMRWGGCALRKVA